MKITFVYPRFEKFLSALPELDGQLSDYFLGDFTTPPSLGLPILAALTPPEVEIELIDDNAGEPIDFSAETDLVAINCFTPQATRAFEIADAWRASGRKVILGGIFPSFRPEECLEHADSVNLGEGEPTWPVILRDLRAGTLASRYSGGARTDLSTVPIPRRELFYGRSSYDWDEDLVQVTRGCLYTCAMCSLPAQMGSRIRCRPVERVVEEMRTLKFNNVYLADDSLFLPQGRMREYARDLFRAIAPLDKKLFVSSTLALNTDGDLLDLATRAGVRNFYCTLNVDPVSQRAIQGSAKERRFMADLVRRLEDRQIRFFASCGIGRDWDGPGIADQVLDLLDATGVRTAEFFIFTPYPGSVHWDRLERQGRIFDRNWAHYNGARVVARPANMDADRLREQLVRLWREFHRQGVRGNAARMEPATWSGEVQVVGKPLRRRGVPGRVAIAGIGVVSPIGTDAETVTAALRAGLHGLRPITRFDPGHFRCGLAGEIDDYGAAQWLSAEERRRIEDPYLQLAIVAARKALVDAGLAHAGRSTLENLPLVLATCNGGLCSAEAEYAWKHGRSSRPFDEAMNLNAQLYGFGKALADALGTKAEVWVVPTACSATTGAIGLARSLITRGYHNTVLVGGVDVLCVANMSGFDALKVTATGRTAPFSLPYGLNLGEGGCFWVVEEMEHALLRGASCHGAIVGHATTSDAHHPTTPDPRGEGVYRVLRNALADSGLALEDIGCINAHGTGTEMNDKAECRGIARLLGQRSIPVVSTKSFFGHCMGATGILEATCQLWAMNAGFIPPTLNYSNPRPGCSLDHVPNEARPHTYRAFLTSNYAFGGNNAALVIAHRDLPVKTRERRAARVTVTGLGVVTSAGLGILRLVRALREGAPCFHPVERFPLLGCRARRAGFVPEFDSSEVDRRLDFKSLNPISRFAVAAARFALADAGLRVSPANAETIGIAMGVCNGPSEMGHMDQVFGTATYQADVESFSNVVANSTAGWVSNLLCIKGENLSLGSGPHAGLQALAFAFDILAAGRSSAMLAMASDEIYAQTFYNYHGMGYLCDGDAERTFKIRLEESKRKILGEGAAALLLETDAGDATRNAASLAEVLAYGMTMDGGRFDEPNLDPDGMVRAVALCLDRAELAPADIDLLVWAPQGNAQDMKTIEACRRFFAPHRTPPPLVTATHCTGYIESAAILASLAAVLHTLRTGESLWQQRTGLPEIDRAPCPQAPRHIIALGSSDIGYNYAAALRTPAAS